MRFPQTIPAKKAGVVKNRGTFPAALRNSEVRVLVKLTEPKTRKQLIHATRLSKNTVIKATETLGIKKLVEAIGMKPAIYSLTIAGKMAYTNLLADGLLTGIVNQPKILFRVHNYSISACILSNKNPTFFYDKQKKKPAIIRIPISWAHSKSTISVCVYPEKACFNLPPIYCSSAEIALANLTELAGIALDELERNSGIRFVREGITARINSIHVARPLDPAAIEAYKRMKKIGCKSLAGWDIHFDCSDIYPEIETTDLIKGLTAVENISKLFDLISEPENLRALETIIREKRSQ